MSEIITLESLHPFWKTSQNKKQSKRRKNKTSIIYTEVENLEQK